ncbi:BTB/POZ domain-containing protein 6-A-like isoform X1 [Cotesia glomerata]|uniref:BTB/POZ domain-containing protein 6-A-like isoform X1 n=2 Tax=Cotesia glomerata TaxID=32391 RepID=UPI001D005D90|nr:BTB/POZ domain-containing protein 6-A-like isoform X1 [Cotesia glomerata]
MYIIKLWIISYSKRFKSRDGTKCYRKPTCILKPIKRFFLKTRIPPITGDCLKSMSQVPLMTEDRTTEENDPHNKVILEVGIPGDTWKYCVDRQALADKSEWFRALLMGDMAPPPSNPPPTICLQHVEKRAFDHLYKYFREEPINFNSVLTARATLDAAHYYLCPELAVIAVDYIIKNLNSSTVINVYHGLSLYALPEAEGNEQIPSAPPENDAAEIAVACTSLLKACLTVIDSAPDEVLREEGFEELTVEEIASLASRDDLRLAKESILFEALDKWAASECRRRGIEPTSHNKRSAVSDEIWYSVRYLLMNDQEFIQGPMASGILSSEESAAIVAKILGHSNHQDNDQLARCIAPYRLSTTPRGRKTPTKAKFGMKPGKKEREDNKKNRRKECTSQGQRACARVGDLVVRVLACVFD